MAKKNFLPNLKLFFALVVAVFTTLPNNAFSSRDGGPERIRYCESDGSVETFAKLSDPSSLLREMEFDLSNETCLGTALAAYTVVKASIYNVNLSCEGISVPSVLPTPVQDAKDLVKASYTCYGNMSSFGCGGGDASKSSSCASLTSIVDGDKTLKKGFKNPIKDGCCQSLLIFLSNWGTAFLPIAGISATAKNEYGKVSVCGSDWYAPNTKEYKNNEVGSYQKRVTEDVKKNSGLSYQNSKTYREWFHRGKEFSDRVSGTEQCTDPATGEPQKYYLRGLQQGDFQCEKYNPALVESAKKDEYEKAYKCCLSRRQNFICLEKKNGILSDHIFCRAGQKCSFKNNVSITYEAYKRENNRLICAKSYSLCPYNFSVGGGTVYTDFFKDGSITDGKYVAYAPKEDGSVDKDCASKSEVRNSDCTLDKEKLGKLKNYCQYYTHCTVVSPITYIPDFKNFSPYFSRACLDFIGDSQNTRSQDAYNPELGIGNQNTFSAPIVQCLKETMENIFKNSAGHSRCVDGSFGDNRDICAGNSYVNEGTSANPANNFVWKKGNKVKQNSLFEILQLRLKNVITLLLITAVIFLGAKILILKVDITNKKEILTFILKIGLVIYFVNGNAWKDIFFDGIYSGSNEISRIFFKINSVESKNSLQSDTVGFRCNFGSLYDEQGTKIVTNKSYPAGKDYLMVWDTLDCKIMQYLNYGPSFSSGTIFALIIASFFTGGIGLMLALSVFMLAFSLIATVIRAMHIFISSAIAIIIYVFISPIIIPLILFERTKNIFNAWLTHLISFSLQPIILFSFLAMFITLSEKILYNDAVFENGALVCAPHCRDPENKIITNLSTCKSSKSEQKYSLIVNPMETTPACILGINKFKDNNGFAMFGIFLPMVLDLDNNKIILILKCALFLYILLQMVDEIPGITSSLTGQNIDVKSANGMEMMKKFTANVRAIQKRAARALKSRIPSKVGSSGDEKKDDDASSSQDSVGSHEGEASADSVGSDSSNEGGEDGNKKDEGGQGSS